MVLIGYGTVVMNGLYINIWGPNMNIKNHRCSENNDYEILTEVGFRDFKGVIKGENTEKIKLEFALNNEEVRTLICTKDHKIITKQGEVAADQLTTESEVYNNIRLINKTYISNDDPVYEILHVDETHTYYANDILSHQCLLIDEMAFIEPLSILEDFWRSVFPTISRSKKSKVLIASTPNGTGNLFHKLYDGAEKNENGFVVEKVPWYDVPGRDEKWKNEQIKSLGSIESFLQEYEIHFLNTGDSSIDDELFFELSQKCEDPKIILDKGHYKIWEEPDTSGNKIYVAGVDISEGVGVDASCINILDITDIKDIKQVAEYHNNQIPPLEFSNKLYSILRNWGSPLALIERNNCGAQVVDRLCFDMGYEKVVSYGAKTANRARPQMGMIAHTNTKYKGVMNMRYFINEVRSVTIKNIHTLKELKDFVRYPNGTWKAKQGFHDDRVMSLMYALYILEKELTERYFEILEEDDKGKPCNLRPMDFGVAMFEDPTSIYLDNEVVGENNHFMPPVVFGMGDEHESDLQMLLDDGYSFLGDNKY